MLERDLAHCLLDSFDAILSDSKLREVWVHQESVINVIFLWSQEYGLIVDRIVLSGLHLDLAAFSKHQGVPSNFVLDGFFNESDAEDILELHSLSLETSGLLL